MSTPTLGIPKTSWEWVLYLKEKLEATPVDVLIIQANTLSIAKALFHLVLTGSFNGEDLWAINFHATIPRATFLKNVRISFGLGKRIANDNEKLIYMQIWASLIRRRFRLDQLLPSEFFGKTVGGWIEDTFNCRENEKIPVDHVCFQLAAQYFRAEGKFKDFRKSGTNRHQFLCLWSWWVLNNAQHISHLTLRNDLGYVQRLAGCRDLGDFVSTAA